jgi:hypothetical protein
MSSATAPPPAKRPAPNGAPPPVPPRTGPQPSQRATKTFEVLSGIRTDVQIVGVYGTGGIGKTELLANVRKIGKRLIVLDVERSTNFLDVPRINTIETFDDLRDALQSPVLNDFDAVGIDSFTKVQELAANWVLANIKKKVKDREVAVSNIADYGWGDGQTYVFETFLKFLSDLDALYRRGKSILYTAHDCTEKVPNPSGEDFLRYEPNLQHPKSGKQDSIRAKVKEWSDHLLFIGYDRAVENGKAVGAGTRTIYPCETATCLAKSRNVSDPIPYAQGDAEIWSRIFKGE